MGTKMAVAFSNIFMNKVETEILSQSLFKPLVWKRYIDDIFSLWTTNRDRIEHFIEQANNHHPTIKFTAEISDKETTFLDTYIYKGARFERDAILTWILDVRTHFKPTETIQCTHFSSCHPQGVKKGFIKGEVLRTNSSKMTFEKKITNFKSHLLQRGYPEDLINATLSEVYFKDSKLKPFNKNKRETYEYCLLSPNTNHQRLT